MTIHKANANEFFSRINPLKWSEDSYTSLQPILNSGHFPKFTKNGPWLAGGALRRVVSNQDILEGDFDIFCRDQHQFQETRLFFAKQSGMKYTQKPHVDEFEIKTSDGDVYKIQLIKLVMFPTAEALIEDFDFTCCMAAYDGETVYYGEWFLFDNARKRLAVNKIKFAVSALRRLLKYQKQGYYACNGCLQEIANAIHHMPPADFKENKIFYVD